MHWERAHLPITEEPDELIAHVRICGGIGPATGRFYPERELKGMWLENVQQKVR